MYSFTVYQHKISASFRVVAGEHPKFDSAAEYSVRVYQGADRQAAIDAAYSGETVPDIKRQIERFGVTKTPAVNSPFGKKVARSLKAVDFILTNPRDGTLSKDEREAAISAANYMFSAGYGFNDASAHAARAAFRDWAQWPESSQLIVKRL